MRWHKQYEAGKDPNAFALNHIKALLADPVKGADIRKQLGMEGEAPAAPEALAAAKTFAAAPARVVLPPSLSKVPAGRGLQAETDNESLEALLH